MSFYRRITRERTLSSFRELNTSDEGLKRSISSFAKPPRRAMYYESFEIKDDYYSKTGVNAKYKNDKSEYWADISEADTSSSSESRCNRSLDYEKSNRKGGKASRNKCNKNIFKTRSGKRSRKRYNSIMSGTNSSSYETNMSYSYSRNKERSERLEDYDRSSLSPKRSEKEMCESYFSDGSIRGHREDTRHR